MTDPLAFKIIMEARIQFISLTMCTFSKLLHVISLIGIKTVYIQIK